MVTDKRTAFWQKCADVTNRPQAISMPMWKMQFNERGRLTLKRDVIPVPQVVLYRPWTKKSADEIVQPIQTSTQLRDAVRRAYHQSFIQPVVDAGKAIARKVDQLLR